MFVCGSCGAVKTADLSEVAFPEDAAVHDEQAEAGPPGAERPIRRDSEPFEPLPDDLRF